MSHWRCSESPRDVGSLAGLAHSAADLPGVAEPQSPGGGCHRGLSGDDASALEAGRSFKQKLTELSSTTLEITSS